MSRRLEILEKFQSLLLQISDFDGRVFKKITMPDSIKQYPTANVVIGDSRYEHLGSGVIYKSAMDVFVAVWQKVQKDIDNQGLFTESIEGLISTVVDTILSTVNLELSYVDIVLLDSIIQYVDWKNDSGVVEINFSVVYVFEEKNI